MATARKESLPAEVRAGFLAPYDSYAHRIALLRFVQDIPLSRKQPTWQAVAGIQKKLCRLQDKPILLCWGGQDFCFTPAFLEKWLAYFPKARVARFPEAGHYVLEDADHEAIPLITAFLRGDS
jgi:haloalkane dehalogenase